MEPDDPGPAGTLRLPRPDRAQGGAGGGAGAGADAGADAAIGALYQANALSLIRLAYVMLGDRPSAEDVVQEAFIGLYRRWDHLTEASHAVYFVRSSVVNGCRSVLRHRKAGRKAVDYPLPAASAEAEVLSGEERTDVYRAVGRLPLRQREALVLRFYLELPDEEIARVMGIRPGTVRSTMHRALAALGQALKETS
jgi:RNA polymerase sigma-70 factor (sigma-E family)